MLQRIKTIVLLLAMLVALPFDICAQEVETPQGVDGVMAEDTIGVQRKYEYFFHEALRAKYSGDYTSAVELLEHCVRLNPNADAALYELSKYMSVLQRDSLSMAYLQRAVSLAPDNYWYGNALVSMYLQNGQMEEALALAETLGEKFPNKSDVLVMLIDLYMRVEDYPNVIKALERLEVKEGKSERISMEMFRVYSMMKDEKHAYEEIVNLSKEYPYDMRYKVLLGDMYLDNGHPDKAYEVYKALEREDSTNINLMLSLASYYESQGMDSLYDRQVERVVMSGRLDNATRKQIMTSIVYNALSQRTDSVRVLNLFGKILAEPQTNTDMVELCARYMVTIRMPADSVKPVLHKILDIDPESEIARSQLLSYAVHEEDVDAIIKVARPAVDYGVKDPVYYYYLGISYYQRDSVRTAIDVLQRGLRQVGDNTSIDLIATSYTMIGDMYHKLGDDKKAFEAYDSCLIYKPSEVGALNNYAYYLSLNNENLERAEEMSRKSIEIEPDNYTYIDTYAWILFMQKRYEEAKVQIDRALEIMGDEISPDDSNIVEHAGDIYYMTGDKEGAMTLWLKAQELGASESGTLEKKIRKKKYIAK